MPLGTWNWWRRPSERIEARRSGRVQDRDLDLPRCSVAIDEIDTAVARRYGTQDRKNPNYPLPTKLEPAEE